MTLAKFNNGFGDKWHLFIETEADLTRWKALYLDIMPHITFNAWKGFTSQTFRKTFTGWLCHEMSNAHGELQLISLRTRLNAISDIDTLTLISYCEIADKVIIDKTTSFKRVFEKFGSIRTIGKAGFSADTFYESTKTIDYSVVIESVNDSQLANFILLGQPENDLFENYDKPVLVVENDRLLSRDLEKALSNAEYKTIFDFKLKTLKLDVNQLISHIADNVDRGLEKIVFETTGQDAAQLFKFYRLFEILANQYPDLKIECYTYNDELKSSLKGLSNLTVKSF